MGVAHGHDEVPVLHHDGNAQELLGMGRGQEAHRSALGAVENRARRDGNPQLEPQIDSDGVGVHVAKLDEDRAEAASHALLMRGGRLELLRCGPAIPDEHFA